MKVLGRLFSSAKLLAGVFASLVTLMVYLWLRTALDEKWYYKPAPCHYPPDIWEDHNELLHRLHTLLTKHRLTHFLCYGSLWGAIRHQMALPWDTDIDLCVLSEEMSAMDQGFLLRLFRWENLSLDYNSREGKYEVRFGKVSADLVLFEMSSDGEWLERIGWESRLFSNLPSHHFPSILGKPPLPLLKYHGLTMPVPRGDVEIMKYFYPDDWWKEIKPPGC